MISLQRRDEVQHLGLNGNVQCRNTFVRHNEAGIEGQGPRDSNTLPLATGKLVGIAVPDRCTHPDHVQQFNHPLLTFLRAAYPVNVQRFAYGLGYRAPWAERGKRILKNNLHVAASRQELTAGQRRDVLAVDKDRP